MYLKFWILIWTTFTKKILQLNKINQNFKNHIFFLKSSFFTASKKILKKVDFFIIIIHMNVQNFRNIEIDMNEIYNKKNYN